MIGPPISRPAELLALTTTPCPLSRARRSAPADDWVMANEIAEIPITTVSPENAPATATTGGLGHRPIATQHIPLQAHATAAQATGGVRRTTASAIAVPTSEPTPYPVIPAAR